jgi:hypothetical protein
LSSLLRSCQHNILHISASCFLPQGVLKTDADIDEEKDDISMQYETDASVLNPAHFRKLQELQLEMGCNSVEEVLAKLPRATVDAEASGSIILSIGRCQ